MNKRILEALQAIPVESVSYAEWISVGMALKMEGFDCAVWDEWSKADCRYHEGECPRKWESFHGGANPVKGGTIIHMAESRGWRPPDGAMEWNDEILDGNAGEKGGAEITGTPMNQTLSPTEEAARYLRTLFSENEHVAYVTGGVWKDNSGKWLPRSGNYDRTAGELLASLEKYPDDLAATFGDWKPGAGAWIRFNPVDGRGVKDENVTRYDFALVESDSMPVKEQYKAYRALQLPIACLIHSGNKSLHAIVRVDAPDKAEYRRRVDFLYMYLQQHGVTVDVQNKNPSRLSRMPGVTRNGKRQYLMATNIGRKSWDDWLDFVNSAAADGLTVPAPADPGDKPPENIMDEPADETTDSSMDELPPMVPLSAYVENPPLLAEELIVGILRCGHKMLISGSPKAGKSFLLMELCIAIAEGIAWLGFRCRKGRVLYINLEIDDNSCAFRFLEIYKALGVEARHMKDIAMWNLRGHARPLNELVSELFARVGGQHFDAIVIDPIYKVIMGDENNASQMAAFCNEFDKICSQTGSAVIYCHHHSKGLQGSKRAMDRASGSGVFARDPDAQLDMIQLKLPKNLQNVPDSENMTAWRLESSLREFPNIKPVNFWFKYPIHRLDETGELAKAAAEGSTMANLFKSSKYSTKEERQARLNNAYDICSSGDPGKQITVTDLAGSAFVDEKTIRRWLKEFGEDYQLERGIVRRKGRNG